MSGIVLSNTAAPFVQTDLTDTVESLYQRYVGIVTADGGEIIEPTTTRAMIAKLIEIGVNPRTAVMVSARFGLKRSGTSILRMYALDGTPFDPVKDDGSAAPLLYATGSYAYKTFEFQAPDTYLKSAVKKAFLPTEDFALMMVAQVPSVGSDRLTALAFDDLVSANSYAAMWHQFNGTWTTKFYVDKNGTHATLSRTAGNAGSTLTTFHASLGPKQVVQNVINTTPFATVLNHAGTFIPDLSQREGCILIGSRFSSAGRYPMTNDGTARWGIGCVIPGITFDQTLKLCTHLDAIF